MCIQSHFNNWQYEKTQNSASKFNIQKAEGKDSSRSCTHKGCAHLFSVCSNNNTVFLCLVSVLEKARCTLIWSTEPFRINFRHIMVSPLKSAPFSVKKNFCLFNILRYTNKIWKNRAHKQGYSSFLMIKFLAKLMLLLHPNFLQNNEYTLPFNIIGKVRLKYHGETNGKNMNLYLSTPSKHIGWEELYLNTFLTLALNGGEWSTSHLRRIALSKEPCYPSNMGQGGPQSWSGWFGGEKSLLPLQGFKSLIIQLAVFSLYWLHYPSPPRRDKQME